MTHTRTVDTRPVGSWQPRAWVAVGTAAVLMGGAWLSPSHPTTSLAATAQTGAQVTPVAFTQPLSATDHRAALIGRSLASSDEDSGPDGATASSKCTDGGCKAEAFSPVGGSAHAEASSESSSEKDSDSDGGPGLLSKIFSGFADFFKGGHESSGGQSSASAEGEPGQDADGGGDKPALASSSSNGSGGSATSSAGSGGPEPEMPKMPEPPSDAPSAHASASAGGGESDSSDGMAEKLKEFGSTIREATESAAATIFEAGEKMAKAFGAKSDDS